MSITSSSLPFTETLVAAAPEAPGVFALWQGGGIVYYGRAATIRIALDEQLRARAQRAARLGLQLGSGERSGAAPRRAAARVSDRASLHPAVERSAAAADRLRQSAESGGSYWDRTSGPCCVRAVLYR